MLTIAHITIGACVLYFAVYGFIILMSKPKKTAPGSDKEPNHGP